MQHSLNRQSRAGCFTRPGVNERAWPSGFPLVIVLALLCCVAGGCSASVKRQPVPEELVEVVMIPDMPVVRTWGDGVSEWFRQDLENAVRQEVAYYKAHPELKMPEVVEALLISGGGERGAFGAGLLCGWTAAGNRPEFSLVTGVSTGALTAPAAFLGSKYDHMLKDAFTSVTGKDIYKERGLIGIFRGDGVASTAPLMQLVSKLIDEEALAAIAAEHAKGRRLLIATTDLDCERQVIWDMGAIASSGKPGALALFRQVMVASASIPIAFSPQYIEVEANGERYDEMHVDGGVTRQVFLWGAGFSRAVAQRDLGSEYPDRRGRIYVIRNANVAPDWKSTKPRLPSIAMRTMSTMIKVQGNDDLFELYAIAQHDGNDFNLAYLPHDLAFKSVGQFDTVYMNKLFDMAFEQARQGYPWKKEPPVNLTGPSSPAAASHN